MQRPPLHRYTEIAPGILKNLDLDEDATLPSDLKKGHIPYGVFKSTGQ